MQQPTLANAEPIPGYRLIERLGRGGYGEVWKAEAPGGMHKAIKFVFGDMNGVGDDGKAAEQEFRSLNRVKTIRHPFILSLERIEVIDGQLLIVMELADKNLHDRFDECTATGLPGIPRAELLKYMEESAEALDLMNIHHQIQHLDIKPQNLFLVHRHVKVADFGLAKDMEGAQADLTGGITPMYAPPETFDGWVSRQSDQYSLAIVYMEMLTGKRPFNGNNTRQLILQHITAQPDLSGLTSPDREAVARALAKKPEDRFSTCTEFVNALTESAPARSQISTTLIDLPEPASLADTASLTKKQTERASPPKTKGLPALVTPKSKTLHPGQLTTSRKSPLVPKPTICQSNFEEIVGNGVLVPTLLLGIGGTGLSFLRSFRQQIFEHFGRSSLPHFRWLLLDTDPATTDSAVAGPSNTALERDEVVLALLRRPAHYLSREGIPPIDTWLRQEDLYRMPKTPSTEGVRGIGRLALCDHYQVISHRIRTALEPLLNLAHLKESERITGLELSTNSPRVVVATSLTGGTGSGMFLDLTYLLRRELNNLGCSKSQFVGILGVPAWVSQSRQNRGSENARAALEELNHYHCSDSSYSATFDTQEGPISNRDRPFHRVTMVPLPGNFDHLENERSSALAAQILYSELLSPLGTAISAQTGNNTEKPFSVVGVQRLVWPRLAILKAASSTLLERTLGSWLVKPTEFIGTHPGDLIEAQWAERQLEYSALRAILESHLKTTLRQTPIEAIAAALRPLNERATEESDFSRVRRSIQSLTELFGLPDIDDIEKPFTVGTALEQKVREITPQADSRLVSTIVALIEQPGLRFAGAEEATRVLRERLERELDLTDRAASVSEETARGLYLSLQQQWLAPRPERTRGQQKEYFASDAEDPLRAWARARLKGLLARACSQVYRTILGSLPELVREVNVIRTQLGEFAKRIADSDPAKAAYDGVCQSIFPDGSKSVAEAAQKLVDAISPAEAREFEHALQGRIRHVCRGIVGVCSRPKEHGQAFMAVLSEQAQRFLDARIPKQLKSPMAASGGAMHELDRLADILDRATPAELGQGKPTSTILGVGGSDKSTVDTIRKMCREEVRLAANNDDLVVWRECRHAKLQAFTRLCGDSSQSTTYANTRSDVNWFPLASE